MNDYIFLIFFIAVILFTLYVAYTTFAPDFKAFIGIKPKAIIRQEKYKLFMNLRHGVLKLPSRREFTNIRCDSYSPTYVKLDDVLDVIYTALLNDDKQ